jgi:group I intron endonuclease
MSGIYKITSPQGRVYVGQAVNIEKRLREYQKLKCKSQTRLYNSLVKYGTINHTFEVIEECNIDLLNERERYWQECYDVLSRQGLNCKLTNTFDKSGVHCEETKKRQSEANIGKTISEEIRLQISNTLKGRPPANKGTKGLYNQTKDSNIKRSISGKQSSTVSKKIIQYTKKGHPIKEWSSAREAGLYFSKYSGSAIIECCKGKRKSIYGFIFKYKTEVE